MTETRTVDFWFDPTCPWAYLTSRWLREVEQVRPLTVSWHQMSLSVLNEGRDLDPDYQAAMERAWQPARLTNAVREKHGVDAMVALYEAFGARVHAGGRKSEPYLTTLAESLAEAGLPAEDIAWADDDSLDDSLRASHAAAIALVGADVGTPVISVDGAAFFGPVISPAPHGEAAGKLWDGCVLVAQTPGFYELKRSRTVGPIFD